MRSQPCFFAVEITDRRVAKSSAPLIERKPPEIFWRLHHASVALALVVGKGDGEIMEETQGVGLAGLKAQEEIVSGATRLSAAPLPAVLLTAPASGG